MLMLQFILTVPVNATNKRKIPKLDTYTKGRLKAAFCFFKPHCASSPGLTTNARKVRRAACVRMSVRTLNRSMRLLYPA